jgi:hypothetical protein
MPGLIGLTVEQRKKFDILLPEYSGKEPDSTLNLVPRAEEKKRMSGRRDIQTKI